MQEGGDYTDAELSHQLQRAILHMRETEEVWLDGKRLNDLCERDAAGNRVNHLCD